jgi:pyruvate/2-oxoglutarate/acetoin dehydrogenase E1 component
MARRSFMQAIRDAQREEMRRDPTVFVMGQDIRSGLWGDQGIAEFGPERVRNTPISEAGFCGAAIGAAMTGMRPIVDFTISTFLYSAMDQIVHQAGKTRYMFRGADHDTRRLPGSGHIYQRFGRAPFGSSLGDVCPVTRTQDRCSGHPL